MLDVNYSFKDTADILMKQTEQAILDQLNELIKRDVLRLIQCDRIVVKDENGSLRLSHLVKLELKDQDYIEKLESENRKLKEIVDKTNSLLQDLKSIGSPTT